MKMNCANSLNSIKLQCTLSHSHSQTNFISVGAKIHYYGPKSTGAGYVEISSMPEAIEITKKMNSLPLRDQPITVTLPNLNHEVRKIKREKHRKEKKVELPYQQELNQVSSKYPSFTYERYHSHFFLN
jgi:hypothetical protein